MDPKASVERVEEISRTAGIFFAECEMLREEFNAIHGTDLLTKPRPSDGADLNALAMECWKAWRAAVEAQPQSAICLSGGGIRSATFSLGVLQALAKREWLQNFDYLSTVSGGGYIGAFISAWASREGFNAMAEGLTKPVKAPPDAVNNPIGNLRAYSNYLSPVWGMSADLFTLFATYLRNLTLIWLQIIPLLCVLLMLPRVLVIAIEHSPKGYALTASLVAGGIASVLAMLSLAYMASDLRLNRFGTKPPADHFFLSCALPLVVAAMCCCWAIAGDPSSELVNLGPMGLLSFAVCIMVGLIVHLCGEKLSSLIRLVRKLEPADVGPTWPVVLYFVVSGLGTGAFVFLAAKMVATAPPSPSLYVTVCVPVALAGFWIMNTLAAGVTQRWTADGYREWWARAGGYSLAVGLGWLLISGLVIYGPELVLDFLARKLPSTASTGGVGALSAVVGLATSAFGYWSRNGGRARQMASRLGTRVLEALAAAFIALLALFLSLGIAAVITSSDVAQKADTTCSSGAKQSATAASGLADVSIHLESMAQADIHVSSRAEKSCTNEAAGETKGQQESALGRWYRHSFTTSVDHDPINALDAASHARRTWILLGVLAAVGLSASFFFGTNVFSLHGMYKNRLERAYLGASNPERRPHWFTGFDDNDNRGMTELPGGINFKPNVVPKEGQQGAAIPEKRIRLFPVINIALNLTRPSKTRLSWQQRKAASFTVTPRVAGSSTVGYVDVAGYADMPWRRRLDTDSHKEAPSGMTLARAMTISGAAASPNMGYHTSSLVAFAMTFFNARLGWWAPNPKVPAKSNQREAKREPTFSIGPVFDELTGNASEDNPWVYLSDGGHFENLGLYEMIRRRCRNILVVDAGCDPKYTYEDVENALRKIRIDFGVPIDLDIASLPRPRASREEWGTRVVTATIQYSAIDDKYADGTLTLVKPLLLGNEQVDVLRYAASRPAGGSPFPQESTADQFFSEAQFESYRALGYQTIDEGLLPEWPPRATPSFAPPDGPQFPPLPPVTARPAVPADAKVESVAAPVAASTGFLAGATRQAVLAAGLGAGAAAGIGGTAYFAGGTVQLDESDRRILSQPIKVDSVQLDPDDRQLLNRPIKVGDVPSITLDPAASAVFTQGVAITDVSIKSLNDQLTATLNKFIGEHPQGGEQEKTLIEVLKNLSGTLNKFLPQDPASGPQATIVLNETQFKELRQAILMVRTVTDLDGKPTPSPEGPPDLKSILAKLVNIERSLDTASPPHAVHANPSAQGTNR
jgi:hypothetical protein